jgi:hypothetical protein
MVEQVGLRHRPQNRRVEIQALPWDFLPLEAVLELITIIKMELQEEVGEAQ